jgi:hypothetical protein
MGGVIAVCSVLAGMDATLIKTGLIMYAFMAGPIFLASAIGSSGDLGRHRSFRGTPPSYMEGKRVKPRLRLIRQGVGAVALLAAFGAVAASIALGCSQRVPDGLLAVLFCGIPVAAYILTVLVSQWGFVRLGWMTAEEASAFFPGSGRLPDSWLEEVKEGKPVTRNQRSMVCGTYLAALIAMLVAAGVVVILIRSGLIPGGPIVKWLLVYGAAAAAYFMVVFTLKRRYVRLGAMSREEAESFPSWRRRWPESRLEPIDKDVVAKDREQVSGRSFQRLKGVDAV